MATIPKKITVRATPGQNTPVPHVLRLEDLLQQVLPAPAKPARGGAAATKGAAAASPMEQLARELGARLRESRGTAAAPARPKARRAKKG